MVVTDGEDNASRRTARELKNRIDKLVKSDKWTFVFNGVGPEAERFAKSVGIPEGNFQRFDDSDAGACHGQVRDDPLVSDGRVSEKNSTKTQQARWAVGKRTAGK